MNANKIAVVFLILMMVAAVAVIVVGIVNNRPVPQVGTTAPTLATLSTPSPTAVPAASTYPEGTPAWFIQLPRFVQIVLGIILAILLLVIGFYYLRQWVILIWTVLSLWFLSGPILTIILVELIFQKSIAGLSDSGKTLVLVAAALGGLLFGAIFHGLIKIVREANQMQNKLDRHFQLIRGGSGEYIRCPNCGNSIGLLGSTYGMDNYEYKYVDGKDVPACPRCGQVLRLPKGY